MKKTLHWPSCFVLIWFTAISAKSQSTIEFQSGTSVEVTSGADICADNVIINGSYSGGGTQCGGALPIEFVAMTAQVSRNTVRLNWKTAAEMNCLGFEIERRSIQRSEVGDKHSEAEWQKVGFVEGSGTSTAPREYSFTDENSPAGRNAYRIKQIDNNGYFTYTSAVEVEVGLVPKVFSLYQNYPNPFNPSSTIEFSFAENGHASLRVYNVLGQEVANLFEGMAEAGRLQQVKFDASRLPSGLYFAKLEAGVQQLIRKMLLMK